jgi:hypothetical protein
MKTGKGKGVDLRKPEKAVSPAKGTDADRQRTATRTSGTGLAGSKAPVAATPAAAPSDVKVASKPVVRPSAPAVQGKPKVGAAAKTVPAGPEKISSPVPAEPPPVLPVAAMAETVSEVAAATKDVTAEATAAVEKAVEPVLRAAAAPKSSEPSKSSEPAKSSEPSKLVETPKPTEPATAIETSPATFELPMMTAYSRAQEIGEAFRRASAESASASARGMAEINSKVMDLVRAQNETNLALWRSMVSAGSVSDALKAQSAGLKQAYESTTSHWVEITATFGKVFGSVVDPLRSTWTKTPK